LGGGEGGSGAEIKSRIAITIKSRKGRGKAADHEGNEGGADRCGD